MNNKMKNKGFSHHFILPVLAVIAVAAIGMTTLHMSSAATSGTTYTVTRCKSIGTIRTGSKGSCVRVLQKSLNKWGKTNHLTVDGMFGGATRNAVKSFQKAKSLKADGVVGSATWGALKPYSVSYTLSSGSGSSATTDKKKNCNAKYGYVWVSSACKYMKKVCVDNDGKWNDGLKKCQSKETNKYTSLSYCEYRFGTWPVQHLICQSEKTEVGSARYKQLIKTNANSWADCRKDHKSDPAFCEAHTSSDPAPQSVLDAAKKELNSN